MKFNPIIEVIDDNLYIPEVRQWSEEKYRLLGAYCDIFTTSMKSKWSKLVYIDLFAGAGYSKIKDTGKIVKSSSLIALSLPNTFSHYIFCEQDPKRFLALKTRIERDFPDKNVKLIHGDSNNLIHEVKNAIPKYSKESTVLSFCFVDPYSLNLDFQTLKILSQNYNIDFLVLLALAMDANRNMDIYLREESERIAKFIDNDRWREDYEKSKNKSIIHFLGSKYDSNMSNLGYKEPAQKQEIRSNVKNLPLYHLAFYSKHGLGNEFWNKIKVYSNNQYSLPF